MGNHRFSLGWPLALAVSFAAYVGLTVALVGRLDDPALVASQALGALALAGITSGRPIASVRAMDARSRVLACAGGLVGVFGTPAVIAAVRMTEAPAGSVVVFWMSGGWAAVAAVVAAGAALRSGVRARAGVALAGGVVALAGVAGVVANWERPSSFSPLVRFPVRELLILGAGALLIAGALAVLRAARDRRLDGALVCAAATAAVAGSAWWAVSGLTRGWSSINEQPAQVILLASAWGLVCLSIPRVLRAEGAARAGVAFALAPVLLSTLIWVEQIVGVAGPQPMIVSGVVAGAVTVLVGSVALWRSRRALDTPVVSRYAAVAAFVPLALACAALVLPAITAHADVHRSVGDFSGSWTLRGWESLAGVTALALGALLAALVGTRAPRWTAVLALAACAVWPLSLSTPMHVLTGGLTPGLEQYYGTEYASLGFEAVSSPWMTASVIACAAGFVAFAASGSRRRSREAAASMEE